MFSITESQKLVKRCMFNYLTVNQDDHSKSFSLLFIFSVESTRLFKWT
ncbi:hypothetical protein [Vibrio brasiliensis]